LSYMGLFWIVGYAVYVLVNKYASWKPIIITVCVGYGAWLSYACYTRVTVWHDSETLWKDVIQQFPRIPVAYNNLACYYQDNNRLEEAKTEFDNALSVKPLYFEALTNRSDVYRKLGKPLLALADARAAIRIKPDYNKAYEIRGLGYAAAGKLDSAILDFNYELIRFPDDTATLINRCAIYSKMGKNDLALVDADKILTIDPDNWKAHQNRGVAYVMTGHADKAYADFTWQIDHFPNNADAFSNRGMLNNMLNHPDAALQDFNRSLAINSTGYDVYGQRAKSWLLKGDNAHAIEDASIAIKYFPQNATYWQTRADALKAAGRMAEAQHDYEQAKGLNATAGNR